MTKSISAALAAHLASEVTTLATCWRVTRKDGRGFYFTDHDRDLAFDGKVYLASSGYSRSAIANDAGMAVDNLDAEGVLDHEQISEQDLRAGLFDHAEVHVFLVNWADLAQGKLRLRRGWFGEVHLTDQGLFRTELRGMTQALSVRIGELYSPECRADLGDHRCRVPIEAPVIGRNTAYAIGDRVAVRTTAGSIALPLPLINAGFEADGAKDSSSFVPTGWTKVSGDWDTHDASNGGLAPQAGSFYLEGGSSAAGELAQTLDLLAATSTDAAIADAAGYRLAFSVWRANSAPLDEGRVVVEFLDAAQTVLSVAYDTGYEAVIPEDSWLKREIINRPVPVGTRFLRVRLLCRRSDGAQANAAFDAITAMLTDISGTRRTALDFENRLYRCITAGTTAAEQPAYDTTIGAETADGTAVFVAENAWSRAGTVSEVLDRTAFLAAIDEPRAGDGWFDGGVLTWETGDNAGRAIEVKSWRQAPGEISLFLPPGYPIRPGDVFRVHPGCDKRLDTCVTRFGIVLNFRGEPYVPGQDELLKYPDGK